VSEPSMFDRKGSCKYCGKPTRAKATERCDACYRLDVAIRNNIQAAEKIIQEYRSRGGANCQSLKS